MRLALKNLGLNKRFEFTTNIQKFGQTKDGKHTKTICFENIKLDDEIIADHVWAFLNELGYKGKLTKHLKVSFTAKVIVYHKGYHGKNPKLRALHPIKTDYCLTDFEDFKIID